VCIADPLVSLRPACWPTVSPSPGLGNGPQFAAGRWMTRVVAAPSFSGAPRVPLVSAMLPMRALRYVPEAMLVVAIDSGVTDCPPPQWPDVAIFVDEDPWRPRAARYKLAPRSDSPAASTPRAVSPIVKCLAVYQRFHSSLPISCGGPGSGIRAELPPSFPRCALHRACALPL
jgi:hypothetical protein